MGLIALIRLLLLPFLLSGSRLSRKQVTKEIALSKMLPIPSNAICSKILVAKINCYKKMLHK
jgi:hypothetical protein